MSRCGCADLCGRDHQPDDDCGRVVCGAIAPGDTVAAGVCRNCADVIADFARGRLVSLCYVATDNPLTRKARKYLGELVEEAGLFGPDPVFWWHDLDSSIRVALYRRALLIDAANPGRCATHGATHPGYVAVSPHAIACYAPTTRDGSTSPNPRA